MACGGYGPVLASGQIVAGIKSKNVVGITALSEGIISTIGFLARLFINGYSHTDWALIISLLIGGLIATPIAVLFVNRFHPQKLKYFIAVISIILGIFVIGGLFI